MAFRGRKLEKEAKELGLTPTKDLKVDESSLPEEDKPHFSIPLDAIIIMSVLTVVVIALVIILICAF